MLAVRVRKLEQASQEQLDGKRLWLILGGEDPTPEQCEAAIARARREGRSTRIMIWPDGGAI